MSVISKNVVIVSASIGSGHTRAATAIRDELIRISPSIHVTVVDFLDQNSSLGYIIKRSYGSMIEALPSAYEFLYRWSQNQIPGTNAKYLTAVLMKARIMDLVRKYKPDLMVFTHPFPACAAAYLRRKRQLLVPLATVMTDFVTHQMWIHKEVDTYFVPNDDVKNVLCRKGIKYDQVFVTGIPISSAFTSRLQNQSDKKPDIPTILVMGGGLGLGALGETVLSLRSSKTRFKMTVITGNNTKVLQQLLALTPDPNHPMTVIGYSDRIHELMSDATLLITKPGALTCSEALALGLPLLLLNPLPGQEEDNADYLTRHGVAVRIPNSINASQMVDFLLSNPDHLSAIINNSVILRRPDAAYTIAATLAMRLRRPAAMVPPAS